MTEETPTPAAPEHRAPRLTPARRRLLRNHGIVALAAFLMAWGFVAFLLFPDTGPAPAVVVPPVVGLPFDEAERKLSEVGLRAALGDSRPSTTAPRRYVLGQTPAAGTSLERSTVITLDVSAGQVRTRVPDLVGMPRDQAVAAIRTASLELGEVVERPDPEARGTVLSTQPEAGQQVTQGSPVALVVSAGPTELLMPDVVGRELFEVRATLEQLGLRISETVYDTSSVLPAGLVVSQVPAAGSPVTASVLISLRVSGRP